MPGPWSKLLAACCLPLAAAAALAAPTAAPPAARGLIVQFREGPRDGSAVALSLARPDADPAPRTVAALGLQVQAMRRVGRAARLLDFGRPAACRRGRHDRPAPARPPRGGVGRAERA
jgi:hypothetical protein